MKRKFLLSLLVLAALVGTAWAAGATLTVNPAGNPASLEATIIAQGDFNVTKDTLDPSVCYEATIGANGSFIVPAQILGQRVHTVIFQAEAGTGTLVGYASIQTTGTRWVALSDGGTAVSCAAADCTFQLNDGTRGPFRRYKITQGTHSSGSWAARICLEKAN